MKDKSGRFRERSGFLRGINPSPGTQTRPGAGQSPPTFQPLGMSFSSLMSPSWMTLFTVPPGALWGPDLMRVLQLPVTDEFVGSCRQLDVIFRASGEVAQ